MADARTPRGRDRVTLVCLVGAEAISNIGSRMTFFAIPWLVLVTTGSPVRVGLVAGAEALTYVTSGVLAAPLQDRLGARLTSIGSDVASVAVMAAIAMFARLDFAVLLALVAVLGVLRAQGDRAKVTLIVPIMGSAGDYARVAAMREGVLRTSTLIGSSLAGVAIAFLGAIGALWLDAATFAVAAALAVVAVPSKSSAEPEEVKNESYFDALRTGFVWFRHNRVLRAITGMLFFTNLFTQASGVVFIPLWVLTKMDDPKALGVVATAFMVGMIAGSVVFAWLSPVLPRYRTLVAGYIIGGAPRFLILALTDSLAVVVVVTLLSGIAMSSSGPTVTAMIYQRTPKDMLARAGGIITATAFGGLPLGGLVGGLLVQALGLDGGIMVATAAYFLVTLMPIFGYGLWRELDDTAPKPPPADGTPLHRLYAGGAATGLRLRLRYADGRWAVRARRGLRTVVPRQRVEAKVAVTALNQLDLEPVRVALSQTLHRERATTEMSVDRMRELVRPAEARLQELTMIFNTDR